MHLVFQLLTGTPYSEVHRGIFVETLYIFITEEDPSLTTGIRVFNSNIGAPSSKSFIDSTRGSFRRFRRDDMWRNLGFRNYGGYESSFYVSFPLPLSAHDISIALEFSPYFMLLAKTLCYFISKRRRSGCFPPPA